MDNRIKILKTVLAALLFGLILTGCKKDEVLLPETNEPEVIEPETPEFGFAEAIAEGQLIIEPADTIIVNLPEGYQTVIVSLEPLHPQYSHTASTKVSTALIEGEWIYDIKCDEESLTAAIAVSAEYPTFAEALLTVTMIDIKGFKQEISKVIKRDVSEDYEFDKATKTYTVKSLNGMRMVNKLLYAFLNDDMQDNNDMNVTLACDIEFPLEGYANNGKDTWIPILNEREPSSSSNSYNGVFDGAGHTILGVLVTSGIDYMGMFGILGEKAVVKNLSVECRIITGKSYVGILAGANYGTIMDCNFKDYYVAVIEGIDNVGGIVGYNEGKIIRCTNRAEYHNEIGGDCYLGGIAGSNYGYIDQCRVEGDVTLLGSGYSVGGIAGRCEGSITNCSVVGSTYITGETQVGGIVGSVFDRINGFISNCSVTDVFLCCHDDEDGDCGAVVGDHMSGTIIACYAQKCSIYSAGMKGGIAGDSDAGIIACFSYLGLCKLPSGDVGWTGMSGILGGGDGNVYQSYYIGEDDPALIGVDTQNSELATTWEEAIIKMNEAIDKYNETAELKCEGKWSGTMSNPVFVTETNN